MTTVTLPFTQANGAATGFTSLAGLTVPQVASNAVSAVTASTTYAGYHSTTLAADMSVQAVVSHSATGGAVGVIARLDTSANGFDFTYDYGGAWTLNRLDAGTPVQLASGSVSEVGARTIKLTCIGTAITAYIDGTQVGTATSSTYQTNTRFGLVITRSSGTTTLDDMVATDAFPATVTATMASAMGSLTGAATAVVTHPATLAAPFGSLVGSMTATAVGAVSFTAVFGDLTAAATAVIEHPATPASSFGGLAGAATAVIEHPATLVGALGSTTASATATITHDVTMAATAALTGSMVAFQEIVATMASDFGSLVGAMTRAVDGVSTADLGALSATATATITHDVTMTVTAAVSGSLTAVLTHDVTASSAFGDLVGSMVAGSLGAASFAADLGALSSTATATIEHPAVSVSDFGALAASLSAVVAHDVTMTATSSLSASATAVVTHDVTMASAFGTLSATATAETTPTAFTAAFGGLAAVAVATITHPATMSATASLTGSMSAFREHTATMAATLGGMVAAAVGFRFTPGAVDVPDGFTVNDAMALQLLIHLGLTSGAVIDMLATFWPTVSEPSIGLGDDTYDWYVSQGAAGDTVPDAQYDYWKTIGPT